MEEFQSSYEWIREIPIGIKLLDTVPLTGSFPPFPWEEFARRLARTFEREGITITPKEMTWRAQGELYEGIGSHVLVSTFSVPSMQGEVSLVVPIQEIELLATFFLTKDSHPPISIHEHAFIESFYRFFILEALYEFGQVFKDLGVVPVLTAQSTLPSQDSLCLDISLDTQAHIVAGRLMISPDFRRSWVEHFTSYPSSNLSPNRLAQKVYIELHLEAGKTSLSLAEWKTVKEGDCVLLDRCSLDLDNFEGPLLLTARGFPVFKIALNDGKIKILEKPLFHEVQTPMAKKTSDEHEEEDEHDDDLSDFDLEDDSEEFDEFEDDEKLFDDPEDEELFEGEENTLEESENRHESDSESSLPESDSPQEEGEKEGDEPPIPVAAPIKVSEMSPITPENIPLVLTIEVGRIQMTIRELLSLEPGNMLELDVRPKNGVDLTVNEKVVGKGELIRIGECLGVRILELGR